MSWFSREGGKGAPEGAENFKMKQENKDSGKKESWRKVKKGINWRALTLALGLGSVAQGVIPKPASAEQLGGKEKLMLMQSVENLAWNAVARLSPQLTKKETNPDGSITEKIEGRLDPAQKLIDFAKEMDAGRDQKEADKSFLAAAEKIKEMIRDQKTERQLLYMLAATSDEAANAVLAARNNKVDHSMLAGRDFDTVGSLVAFLRDAGQEAAFKASDVDDGRPEDVRKRAFKVASVLLRAASVYAEEGDPKETGRLFDETLR